MKDWDGMAFPKNARIKDRKAIDNKAHICEYCGRRGWTHMHHIKTKGSGGNDTADNLIELCAECHAKAHTSEITKEDLKRIKRRKKV